METERIAVLDVLRGVAILGTLGTNVWVFMDPQGLLGLLTGSLDFGFDSFANSFATIWFFLSNGKSLALLTILFGVGVEIQRQSALRRGARWPGRYLWRATLLLLDGVVHYVLVTEVDVLMAYAVTSMVVAYVVSTSERAQRVWIFAAGGVHLLFVTLGSLALVGAGQGESVQVSVYTGGGYLDQVSYRLEQWPILRAESIFILPFATCLFLLGSRLYRAGVFGPEGRALRDRLMWAGLGVGLPLNLLTTTFGNELALVDRYLVPPLVALGFLGLLTRVFEDRPSWLATRFALVGRMSLSCYMLQNAVAMVLCFGWGFGLNSVTTHRPLWTFGVWVLISAIMMVVSTLWLRRFRQGPVEAAWRWAYQARVDTRSMAT